MKVIYSAIFGAYEELKEPTIITPGWRYIMFTDQPFKSDVWEISPVELNGKNPQLTARYFKIIEWTQWEQSIWIDGSFVIDTDLNVWWDTYFKGGLCAPGHPLRNDVYNECLDCIIAKRGDPVQIRIQMEHYKRLGIPKNGGIIQSGILMRENSLEVIDLCKRWYKEIEMHSIRDQIAFAKVSLNCTFVHTYRFDYRQGKDFIYKNHFNKR